MKSENTPISPESPTHHITLVIDAGSEADAEELARLTQQLRAELLQLEVEDVIIPKSMTAPAGSKSADPMAWGTLLVSLSAASGLLPHVVDVVKAWFARTKEQPSITMELDGEKLVLTGVSSQQIKPLIDQWLARHAES